MLTGSVSEVKFSSSINLVAGSPVSPVLLSSAPFLMRVDYGACCQDLCETNNFHSFVSLLSCFN